MQLSVEARTYVVAKYYHPEFQPFEARLVFIRQKSLLYLPGLHILWRYILL